MPMFVGIFSIYDWKNSITGLSEPEKRLNFLIFLYINLLLFYLIGISLIGTDDFIRKIGNIFTLNNSKKDRD